MPIRDSDIWYHLLYGKYHIDNLTPIPDHTIFSWTPASNETIYCVWLGDVVLYLLYLAGGLPLLIFFRYSSVFFLLYCCFKFSSKENKHTHPLTWLACLIASQMAYGAIVIKPELFSFIYFTLFVWNWWHIKTEDENAWRHCYLFPFIMLLWVNTHGVFFIGVAFLALAFSGEMLNSFFFKKNSLGFKTKKHLLAGFILTLLSIFINPYGYEYVLEIANLLLPAKHNLLTQAPFLAYQSPFTNTGSFGFIILLYTALGILLYLLFANRKHVECSLILTNLFTIYLYARMTRTTFFWPPVFLFSVIYLLGKGKSQENRRFLKTCPRFLLPLICVALGSYLSFFTLRLALTNPEQYAWMGFGIPSVNPVEESEYIKRNFPNERIGNTYNQGAYLLWKLWPDNKVFIDQRYFPYKEWFPRYWDAFHNIKQKDYIEVLSRFVTHYDCRIWCIGLENISAAQWFYFSPEWQLVFYSQSSAVFARKDIFLSRSSFQVGNQVDSIKNFQSAVDVLKWTLVIKDWRTAEKIIFLLRSSFHSAAQQESSRKLAKLTEMLKSNEQGLLFNQSGPQM